MRVRSVCEVVCAVALLVGLATPAAAQTRSQAVDGPRLADRASAADDATAARIARAFHHPVVVDSATTDVAQTTAQPDGTEQITVYRLPVRRQTADGWAPLATADGTVTAATAHDASGGRQAYTYVDNTYPNQSYLNGASAPDGFMHAGYVQAAWADDGRAHLTRGFFQIDTRAFDGRTVLAAHLNLNLAYTPSCTSKPFDVWVSNDISSATTWNRQPAVPVSVLNWHSSYTATNDVQYTGCSVAGGRPLGVDVKSPLAAAVGRNWAHMTFRLNAPGALEGDTLSWKKFANNPSITATVNRAPGAPAGRSITPCGFCTTPEFTNSTTPTLTGATTDPDGDSLRYSFEVWAGSSASPTTRVAAGTSALVGSGQVASWKVNTALVNGQTYEYRVLANDGTVNGPWSSGWAIFSVDTTAPAPPKLVTTPVDPADPVSTDPNHFSGTVGRSAMKVSISSAAADHVSRYVYGFGSPLPTTNIPACNTSAGGFTTVCPSAVGGSFDIAVSPTDDVSTLSVETADAAGNVPSAPSRVSFYASGDYSAVHAGHSWEVAADTDGTVDCSSGQVPDTATSNPQPLALSGGLTCGAASPTFPPPHGLLHFDGTASHPTTSARLNTSASYTVAAWLRPSGMVSTGNYTALGQAGTANSAFYLQVGSGLKWRMCIRTQTTTVATDCVDAGTAAMGQWAFVVGVYDAINHEARLYVSSDGSAPAPATGFARNQGGVSASGSITVGRAESSASSANFWQGDILNPAVFQGVANTDQISKLGQSFTAPSAIPPIVHP
jgi:concanavalin A-like lectin/glucanase superfamily protein